MKKQFSVTLKSLLLVFATVATVNAAPMTTASRIEGALPLGVTFDAVDHKYPSWTSNVIQPRGFVDHPINCTGVKINRINVYTNAGTGTLYYVNNSTSLQWKAPDDSSAGSAVDVSGGGNFLLSSNNSQYKLYVWVNPANLPGTDTNDEIEVVEGGVNADYASFHYKWNFGDPSSGNWKTGAIYSTGSYPSKNIAYGHIAGHLYKDAGTYTVTLEVTDDESNAHNYSQDITVLTEPSGGWTEYYFANDGDDDTGDGSMANPYKTIDKAKTLIAHGTKFLFKRGDSFDVDSTITIATTTVSFEAYGSGPKPKFLLNDLTSLFYARHGEDVRLISIWAYGNLGTGVSWVGSYPFMYTGLHGLIYDVDYENFDRGVLAGGIDYGSRYTLMQECNANTNIMNVWIENYHPTVVLGCSFTDNKIDGPDMYEAPFRTITNKLVLSHSHFENCGPKYMVRFMGNDDAGDTHKGNWYIASYNRLIDSGFQPTDNNSDSLVIKNVLLESNKISHTINYRLGFRLFSGQHITIRNNIFTSSADNFFIRAVDGYNAYDFHYHSLRILNNVMYNTYSNFTCFFTDSLNMTTKTSNYVIKNNIFYAPNTSLGYLVRFTEWLGSDPILESDNNLIYTPVASEDNFADGSAAKNLSEWQVFGHDFNTLLEDPLFVNITTEDFRLQKESGCRDKGSDVPWIKYDFDGNERLGNPDIGVFEYETSEANHIAAPTGLRIK